MFDILSRITEERLKRGWSEYRLAENSGITQSTISTWYRKQMQPSISSLEKICNGLGISLAQFFSIDSNSTLSGEQTEILEHWLRLDTDERTAIRLLLETMNSKK